MGLGPGGKDEAISILKAQGDLPATLSGSRLTPDKLR